MPQLLSNHSGFWNLKEAVPGPFQPLCCSQAHGLILGLLERARMQEALEGYQMLCPQSFIETGHIHSFTCYMWLPLC